MPVFAVQRANTPASAWLCEDHRPDAAPDSGANRTATPAQGPQGAGKTNASAGEAKVTVPNSS